MVSTVYSLFQQQKSRGMISIYKLKPWFQNCLRPICFWITGKNITANEVTIATAVLSVITGVLLTIFNSYRGLFLFLPFFMLIRMALNAIDGLIAKEFNMKTNEGAIYNELCDVVSDIFLYLPFAFLPGFNSEIVFFIIILSIITELSGVLAFSIGAERAYDGPMGKSDRAFVFSILAIVVGIEIDTGIYLVIFLVIIILLLLFMTNIKKKLISIN